MSTGLDNLIILFLDYTRMARSIAASARFIFIMKARRIASVAAAG